METSKNTANLWQWWNLFAKSVYHLTISLAIFIIIGGKLLFDILHKLVNDRKKEEFNGQPKFAKRSRK